MTHRIKHNIVFVLILALVISLPIQVGGQAANYTYADTNASINLDNISEEITITQSGMIISASTSTDTITTGPANKGITITGSANNNNTITVSGEGANNETINIILDDVNIITDGPVRLTNNAKVNMTLEGTNTLDSSQGSNLYPGIMVTSPNALTIIGSGVLTAKGYAGAGIGGKKSNDSTTNEGNGDNITISGSVSINAFSVAGAGIGGGNNGSGSNISILGNANVNAISYDAGAGIGGGQNSSGSQINISENAVVDAKSNSYGAGIGGGNGGAGTYINISGSADVDANSSSNGAGIGGGNGGAGTYINILGSADVDAKSNANGAGIGGGNGGAGTYINISGSADVDAVGDNGAGIGGGYKGLGSQINIFGDAVVSAVGNNGAGIGGGQNRSGSQINISGNSVVSAVGTFGAGIGGGQNESGNQINISGGFVTAKGNTEGHDIGNGFRYNGSVSPTVCITGGSIQVGNGNIGGTPTDGTNPVYKVTVPAIKTYTGESLRGNLEVNIPLSRGGVYSAKTISSGACEHGSNFPSDSSVAYVYLPEGSYENITVGKNQKTFTEVVSKPSLEQNTFFWKKVNVTFDKTMGDQVSTTGSIILYGDEYGELPVATKVGYTFSGWFTSTGATELITSGSIVTTDSAHTLYAHWDANKYKVEFNATDAELSLTKKDVAYDSKYGDLPSATKRGYIFKGWYDKKTGGNKITADSVVSILNDHILYAQWTAANYDITYAGNGGKIKKNGKYKASKLNRSYSYGDKFGAMPKAKRTGYKFKGWYTKKSGGKKISSDAKMTFDKNTTLYAHWAKNGKIVKCKSTKIRKGPGVSKSIIGYAKKGQKICILKKVKNSSGNSWYKVKVGKKTGYIYSKYVKKI